MQIYPDSSLPGIFQQTGHWLVALIDPTGKVVALSGTPQIKPSLEQRYILPDIVEYVSANYFYGDRAFIQDPLQFLTSPDLFLGSQYRDDPWGFHSFHRYQLAWHGRNPSDIESVEPDGDRCDWQLYDISKKQPILERSLPSNWWEMSFGQREALVESRPIPSSPYRNPLTPILQCWIGGEQHVRLQQPFWHRALVAPDGTVLELKALNPVCHTSEWMQIRRKLETKLENKLVASHPVEMLCNPKYWIFHNLRAAWDGHAPVFSDATYPPENARTLIVYRMPEQVSILEIPLPAAIR